MRDYPPIDVGILELNRNPDNYFAEIEQAAFSPSNIVPGIGFSPDKMLQARIFSYADAHRYRLGTHYEALPVNAPKVPVHNYTRMGRCASSRRRRRPTPSTSRIPSAGPKEDPCFREPPLKISGDADRYNHRVGNDDYTQAGNLFRLIQRGAEGAAVRQYRCGDAGRAGRDHQPPAGAFLSRRSRIRHRRRQEARPADGWTGRRRGIGQFERPIVVDLIERLRPVDPGGAFPFSCLAHEGRAYRCVAVPFTHIKICLYLVPTLPLQEAGSMSAPSSLPT